MRRRLAVVTVGCKANFADSAEIASHAIRSGFELIDDLGLADVLIINSCTVTHRADRDSRALARRLRRGNPRAVLVMTGCYARVSPQDRGRFPDVDHWIGGDSAERLPDLLRSLSGLAAETDEHPSHFEIGRMLGRTRTFLRIQDGCDAACAYCIVPKARGGSRSVPARDLVAAVRKAEVDGAGEIVLTGIHAGRYGHDLGMPDGLAALLEELLASTTRCRFRLGSVEPPEITPRLVAVLGREVRICPHLHVPLQSGSDEVLRRMRRSYDGDLYREIVRQVARDVPGVRLGTDVIAGFPGETEEDFDRTLRLLLDSPVSYIHAFPYSPREGTESAAWGDDVPHAVKKRRMAMLREVDESARRRYLSGQEGRTLAVIAETERKGTGEMRGTSENYIDVVFRPVHARIGRIVPVRILSVKGKELQGRETTGDVPA